MFSYGKIPFFELDNKDVALKVVNGMRPEQPKNCPDEVFEMMKQCWNAEPEERPSFKELAAAFMKMKNDAPEESKQVDNVENYYNNHNLYN